MGNRGNRIVLFAVTLGLTFATGVRADTNVREVQEKLRNGGFYSGEVDGAYSSDLSAALSRYQIRNGLPITGQLDVETSKALGAKPAVGPSTAGTEQNSSETWRRLRKGERRTSTSAQRSETIDTEARDTSSSSSDEAAETSTETRPRSAPAATAAISSENTEDTSSSPEDEGPATGEETRPTARTAPETTEPASAPPATTSADESTTGRFRDYVAAYVLAGLDRNVGGETEFFADRVQYYDQGIMDRERIREDLKRYDERWPERHFWVAGKITVEPQSDNRVRVTFPLGFKLRNANKQSSGKVDKTLLLEPAGDDLQIVAVNERKAD